MLPEISEIGKRRKRAGLTQTKLAKLAGVSQSLIAKIEAGSVDPSYSNAKRLLDAMDELVKKEQFRAKDVGSERIITAQKDDTVGKATELMKKHNVSQLPVLEGKLVVGSISEKTVLDRMARGEDIQKLSKLSVESVMEEAFPRVDENAPLEVISTLLQHNPAVLVTKKDRIVRIITKYDLLGIIRG